MQISVRPKTLAVDRADRMIPDTGRILGALDRVEHSRSLAGHERLRRLLVYLVRTRLAGRDDALRETAIGNSLYRAGGHYDPSIHSTVRVEVRRLRSRLAAFYEEEGRHDPVHIVVPVGSYVPRFEPQRGGRRAGR